MVKPLNLMEKYLWTQMETSTKGQIKIGPNLILNNDQDFGRVFDSNMYFKELQSKQLY